MRNETRTNQHAESLPHVPDGSVRRTEKPGDYFFHLAFRDDQNADFLLTYDSGSLMPGSYFLLWRESGSQFDRKMIFIFFKEFPGNTIVQRSG